MTILEVRNLKVYYYLYNGVVKAVDDVSFTVEEGEILGIAGESGSGKSTLAHSILGLVKPPGKIVGGEIIFQGRDLTKLSEEDLRRLRGREISMVFQDPNTYLNPIMKVGYQVAEVYEAHQNIDMDKILDRVAKLFKRVRMTDPEKRVGSYPHELSGGMKQRALISMAVALKPKLIILDEPTSALDVTIQLEIIDLLREMRDELNASMIFISHDLELLSELTDKLMIMYAGRVVEYGYTKDVFKDAKHPYTEALINSIKYIRKGLLPTIEGEPPSLINPPKGCRFHPRCPRRFELCDRVEPKPISIAGRIVSCHLYGEEYGEGG
ncbi:MAG TPA: ABC transporter ATP-binding protein [Thermoprotei archaeon]|nr:ABC transporter ATP-binding protein [Thermoprotei archaeon]